METRLLQTPGHTPNAMCGDADWSSEQREVFRGRFLNKIICGDSLRLVKEIPDSAINLIITSPPYYKQRDYGQGIGNEETVEDYLENLYQLFHECVRITREDGNIVFNMGDKYESGSLLLVPYRFALGVLDREAVKLVNAITWVKLNPTPRQFRRRLVSSTEPFFHFVKSDSYWYDINAFMGHLDMAKKKSRKRTGDNGIGSRYFRLIEESALSPGQKALARKELHQVIQEVNEGGTESFRMKIKGIHAPAFGGQEGGRKIQMEKKGFTIIRIRGDALKRDVIECAVETLKGSQHPAIYPEYLVSELVKLLTRKGDTVLDPFMGSGTTAVACIKLDRNYVGFEVNPDYCREAETRLAELKHSRQMRLEL